MSKSRIEISDSLFSDFKNASEIIAPLKTYNFLVIVGDATAFEFRLMINVYV